MKIWYIYYVFTIYIVGYYKTISIIKLFLLFLLGSSAYDSVRSLSYAEADVFLVCYKVSDPSTLYNVKNKWMPEIRQYRSNAPVILCGCQSDLRNDSEVISSLGKRGRAPVTPEQALGKKNMVKSSFWLVLILTID